MILDDWERSETYADLKQEEENRAYEAAKCDKPHEDGSTCMPTWDGIMFVCFDRILREREEPSGGVGTSQNYREWVGSAGLS